MPGICSIFIGTLSKRERELAAVALFVEAIKWLRTPQKQVEGCLTPLRRVRDGMTTTEMLGDIFIHRQGMNMTTNFIAEEFEGLDCYTAGKAALMREALPGVAGMVVSTMEQWLWESSVV